VLPLHSLLPPDQPDNPDRGHDDHATQELGLDQVSQAGQRDHGIDGLQKNGHILVWYGLNWSLDLYEQFNARVRRQGQGAPVICHRIMCQDTLDQAQALALDDKATTQAGLRNAIKEYRQSKGH